MTSFALEPIYGSTLIAAIAAIGIIGVMAIFAPATANPAHRRLLILLRSAAAISLMLVIFRPSLIRTDNRPADATLVVAVDLSRSMTLPDNDDADRWTTQVGAWQQLAGGLDQFRETLDVQLIGYEREARAMPSAAAEALDEIKPEGEVTDLSQAAAFSLQAAGASPLAGVVFIGDGRHTAPSAKRRQGVGAQTLGAQRSVETLNSMGVPFWSIPIGPAAGETSSRDAAVEGLDENFQLFAGNEFDVVFSVLGRGLAGVEVPVRLRWIDSDGKRTEAAERFVIPETADDTTGMIIPLIAPEPGSYRLEVAAVKQPGELVTGNNRQTAFVEIREGGGRILFLEGELRPEQMFLRRALRRFPDLDLRFKWLRTDRSWPIDLDDWLESGKYDIYILGDLDASALGDKQLEQLADTVGKGAGLVTLGGFQSYGPGGYADSPLADVLPVRMDSSRRRSAKSPRKVGEADAGQIAGPLPIQLRRAHPITDLGGDDPASLWRQLPPLSGANRFVGPKVAPGVEVLLETNDGLPLLVVGEYGRGRVASLALDSTYRWWRDGQSEAHRRFWRQLILWLLSREETTGDAVAIELDSRRFAIDNPPEFRASVRTVAQRDTPVELVAEVIDGDNIVTQVPVSTESLGSDRASAIRGKIPELKAGFYGLRVRAADDGSIKPDELAFQVVDESRELAQPMADPVYLRQLAEITANHGGAAFGADEIDQLIDTIAQRRRQAETPIVEKHRLGDGPMSGWILFALFAGCLSAEWYLRRRWGMA